MTAALTEHGEGTGTYLYGIVPSELTEGLEALEGVDGEPLRALSAGPVAAVVASVALARPPGRRAELLAHSGAVDALAARGPVLPAAFGSVIDDEQDFVDGYLRPQAADLAARLGDLRDCAQFTVRAAYDEEAVLGEVVDSDPVVADLRERTRRLPGDVAHPDQVRLGQLVSAAVDRRRAADAEALRAGVEPLVVASVEHEPRGLYGILNLAVLVETAQREDFEQRLEELAEAGHPLYRVQLLGPLAPYDFTGELGWD